jgi:hypothetical protein
MTQPHLPPRPAGSNAASPVATEPPLKEVLVELWENLEKLMRQELALASAELDLKAQQLKRDATAFGAGAGLLLVGALALVAALILLLSQIMPAWVAALITGGTTVGIGFALLQKRPNIAALKPNRTLESIQKDVQILREARK